MCAQSSMATCIYFKRAPKAQEVRISGSGEDIWMAVLRREVRISGSGEDIWMAVLEKEGDGERRGRDQGAAPAYMLAPWLLEFGRSREHRLEAQK